MDQRPIFFLYIPVEDMANVIKSVPDPNLPSFEADIIDSAHNSDTLFISACLTIKRNNGILVIQTLDYFHLGDNWQ
jgi:hypothetical protein